MKSIIGGAVSAPAVIVYTGNGSVESFLSGARPTARP